MYNNTQLDTYSGRHRLKKNTLIHLLLDMIQEYKKQPLRIYDGVVFKSVEAFAKNFVYFYWYQLLKSLWTKSIGQMNTTANLIVASSAAVLNQTVTGPLDVISTHLHVTSMPLKSILSHIYSTDGLRGFYRGMMASLILCSNPAITNASFDRMKLASQIILLGEHLKKVKKHSVHNETMPLPDLSPLQSFFIGAVAKAIATFLTYPYIRTKVIVQTRSLLSHKTTKFPNSVSDTDNNMHTHTHARKYSNTHTHRNLKPANERDSTVSLVCNTPTEKNDQGGFNSGIVRHEAYDNSIMKVASFCVSDLDQTESIGVESDTLLCSDSNPALIQRHGSDVSVAESEKGVAGVLVATIMTEGLPGLYRGLGLQLMKTVLASAIMFMIKENIQNATRTGLKSITKLLDGRQGSKANPLLYGFELFED